MHSEISVALIDDHPMVLQGIKACLNEEEDIYVADTMHTAEEFLEIHQKGRNMVAVVDINLPDMNGIELISELKKQDPDIKVIVFSMHQNVDYTRLAMAAGANGYVLKEASPNELILAIRTVVQGSTFFSSLIAEGLISNPNRTRSDLTSAELKVLKGVAEGKASKLIARDQDISVRTVETHRRNIKQKLGAKSPGECVRIALSLNLI